MLCVYCVMMRGFYYKTGKFRTLAAMSQLSDLTPGCFGLQACDASVFGPQLWAGWEHMLPGPIWSPHRGNQVKVNPDRRFANVLSPLALHQIACDEYIPYPPTLSPFFSLVLARQAFCPLSGHIMKVWLERLFLLFYNQLTAKTALWKSWRSCHHY